MRKQPDPHERALRARIAAFSLHARYDPRQTTAKARATFATSFERLVDPDLKLPLAERLRRAEAARRAHYARLARLSHLTRRSRRDSKSQES
jgi:uncharacterized membrane protein YccC